MEPDVEDRAEVLPETLAVAALATAASFFRILKAYSVIQHRCIGPYYALGIMLGE